jgi:hypothetical protein
VGDRRQRFPEGPEVTVVCGAGAAGMAAALAAAHAGARVWLVEARPRPGGTVTHALIHTLGGLYDSSGEFLNGGLARELAGALLKADPAVRRRRIGRAWVLSVCPDTYQAVVQRWIEAEPRITASYRARVTGVVRAADRVTELEISGPAGPFRLRARAVVDATGTAAVVRLIDPSLLQDDPRRPAAGLIFRMRGVTPGALAFPNGLGVVRALRRAAEDGGLPPGCGKAWVDAGVYEDEAYVKLFVPLPDGWSDREECGEITREAVGVQEAVVSFLRGLPGFAEARVSRTGDLGVRDGGRVCGEYRLTGADVRQGRKFADPACRACWPIEYWDPDRGVNLEYLPDHSYYEIPLRALRVRGLRNVWAVGKCLSADHEAQASARVVGSCWAMGEAAGKAVAAPGEDAWR